MRLPASRQQLDALAGCLLARRPVVLAMLEAGGNLQAPEVKRALYRCVRLGVRITCTVATLHALASWLPLHAAGMCCIDETTGAPSLALLQLPVGAWQRVPGPAALC